MEPRESVLTEAREVASGMESRKFRAVASCLREGIGGDDDLSFCPNS